MLTVLVVEITQGKERVIIRIGSELMVRGIDALRKGALRLRLLGENERGKKGFCLGIVNTENFINHLTNLICDRTYSRIARLTL